MIFPIRSSARPRQVLGALFAAAALPGSVLGCSVCGCSLSSDWAAQGYSMSPGFDTQVNYQYYDQDDLRSGLGHADRADYPLPSDQELQQDTLTRSITFGADYILNPTWAVGFVLPWYDRFHSTMAPGDTELSESRASGVGDARLMLRWQKFRFSRSFGLQLGLKLPTGEFDQNFITGPEVGTLLDRGLQLGTGTTDAILGASYFGRSTTLGYFAQALIQQALTARDGFLPSSTATVNVGVRYLNTSIVTPMFQVNARWDTREHGVLADSANSGDAVAYLSPGVTIQAGTRGSFFTFVQVPVYQRVNGLQLEPHWLLSSGFTWRL